LHIGMNRIVKEEDILFLIPKEELSLSRDSRKAVTAAIGKGRIQSASEEEKTYIVAKQGKGFCVYASPISSVKLTERKQ